MDSDKRDEDTSVQYTETAVGRPSKKSLLIAHVKRFWWVHLLIICCIVALAVPLTIFVGIKHLAQSQLNKATLAIQGITVTNSTTESFHMAINSTIKGTKTKATVHSFVGAMYLEDEPGHVPFAHINFPETKNKPMQSVNISQLVPIENLAALTTFNSWILANESVRVTVDGNTTINVPGISHKYHVHFHKILTLTGLDSFSGMSVANSSVTASNFSDGSNFHTTVTIPNKSVLSFEIGNATFNTYLEDTYIGPTYINNVFLHQGDNVYPLHSKLAAIPVLTALDSEPYCGNGTLPITISGSTVSRNGENLTYYSDALASSNDTVQVPLADAFKAIGINAKCPSS
ncbi:hypothetical protein CMQ_7784 [Grosmannia clavigera kw1407]|uniref:Uncharacterized protein n=1 Tax=Grosmannia clavigera (strain kw1407 / UAMH 11150) TaxID=655863 RepID=F0XSB8_GROCL|nr:uncharacterized protein CMQ_7784 [Grosmannia clavigera kw1407]EFW99416.1 hypothetical protein CMQ_7784 [Grosmannia clavigera kw1407]